MKEATTTDAEAFILGGPHFFTWPNFKYIYRVPAIFVSCDHEYALFFRL